MRNTTAEIMNTTDLQDSVLDAMACVIGQNLDLPAGRVMQSDAECNARDFDSPSARLLFAPSGDAR